MKKFSTLRFLLLVFIAGLVQQSVKAQSIIFSENIGVPTGTTTIVAYSGGTAPATFQNKGVLTYDKGGAATPADIRATSVSNNTGASGGGNVFFTTTSGEYGFSIESINAAAYNTLVLDYNYRKEAAPSHANFAVDFWNGSAWVNLANTSGALFNEAVNAATGWYPAKTLSLPIAAQINGLKLRFIKTGTASIRIDDIKLSGVINTPTTTSITPNSATTGDPGFTLTVNGTGFINGLSTVTWNGANRTTTFVSATQLTAAIPLTDLTAAGSIPVGVTTTGALATSNTQPFTINAATGPVVTLTSPLAGFGNICINNTAGPNSFTIDASNLDGTDITLDATAGFTYSETPGGSYTATLTFSYTGTSFTGKAIYVKFNPIAVQSYNNNINLHGGGVTSYPIPVTGAGINTTPTVLTGGASAVTSASATLAGSISSIGCTAVTTYGIEYSTVNGFSTGSGTQVPSGNLSGGNFSSSITLVPNTVYYYRAYANNAGGIAYGPQQTVTALPVPVVMGLQPGLSFTENFNDIGNWQDNFVAGVGANHFSSVLPTTTSPIPTATVITTATNVFRTTLTSGGVQKGTIQTPPSTSIVLLSTGSPDNTTSAAIDFNMDFTGVNAGTLSFDYETLNNSTGDRNGSLRVYGTVDGVTYDPITDVLNFTNNVPISGSKTNVPLPVSFNNSATARLRFYYFNGSGNTGTGSRPKISIDNLTVTAVATTPCSSPTAPATNLVFGTINDVSIQGSFTAATPGVDEYLVIVSTNSSLTNNPVDGQIYNVGDNVGDGTVVSRGSGTTFTATGLTALTTYYFFVFPVNSICTGGPKYFTTTVLNGSASTVAGLPPCTPPASQPTSLVFGTTGINTIAGSFNSTAADEYLVVRSTSSTLSNTPVDGQSYNTGDVIGNGTVVESTNTTSFTAGSLSPNTQYYFFIFSLNSQNCINGPVYNITAPLTGTQTTMPLPPCATPGAQPYSLTFNASNTAISGAFSPGVGADDYFVVRSTSATLSATPSDNTDYAVGTAFGGGVVVADGATTGFLTSGLSSGTTYYFYVFAANKNCSGGTKYLTAVPLSGNVMTTNDPVTTDYFGTLHSHSDYSDGNQDHPGFTPADDYNYAITAQCMDYLGISEHNHFSSADNPGNQIANYHMGTTQANAFTAAHPNFLALYGMEWGVISGGGHVVVYGDGMDNLWGWETGSGGWGPTNNYDVFVPKSTYTGPTGLFKTVNDNIGTNTFATLAHPNPTDYNNIAGKAYNDTTDNAIVGTAIESGPATSTNTTYSNPGSSLFYLFYYQTLLSKGYHVGPTIDHDNHNTTFGHTTFSRTAVIAPALTKTEIIKAIRNMHFYATQDCDTKVDFTINTKIMGSVFSDRNAPFISVRLSDATTDISGAVIRVMAGTPGSGTFAVKIDSAIGTSLDFVDLNLSNLATGYYYIDVAMGTKRVITSPIWYTRTDNNIVLPVRLSSFTVQKMTNKVKLNWTTVQEVNTREFRIERSTTGNNWETIATVAANGNSNTLLTYTAYDLNPAKGTNLYRLKTVDIDNKSDYSAIRRVNFDAAFTYTIYPNPASTIVEITVDNPAGLNGEVTIFNAQSQQVMSKKMNSGNQIVRFDISTLNAGVYFVKIQSADGAVSMEKLVKQ